MSKELIEDEEGLVHDKNVEPLLEEDPEASEAVVSNLDFTSSLATQVALTDLKFETILPLNTIDRAKQIQFRIQSSLNRVVFPQYTYVMIRCKVVHIDGTDIPNNAQTQVIPINGLSSSLFEDVTVQINNVLVSEANRMYHYRADLDTRLLAPKSVKKGYLRMCGFDEEETAFENLPPFNEDANVMNWAHPDQCAHEFALHRRYIKSRASKEMFLMGTIHHELFEQEKFLPPQSTLYLAFHLHSRPTFPIMTRQERDYRIEITGMQLLVGYVDIDNEIVLDAQTESESKPYLYPVRRVRMEYFPKLANTLDWSQYNLVQPGTNMPRRIYAVFVRQTAFDGSRQQDPFNYAYIDCTKIGLKVAGEYKPYPELTMQNADDILWPYFSLVDSTGTFPNGEELGITIDNYKKRNFIIGWDLTPSKLPPGVTFELPKSEPIDLIINLRNAVAQAYFLILYFEYDAEIEIDARGNVRKKNFGTPP